MVQDFMVYSELLTPLRIHKACSDSICCVHPPPIVRHEPIEVLRGNYLAFFSTSSKIMQISKFMHKLGITAPDVGQPHTGYYNVIVC